jgi:hypothetical protein
MWDTLREIAAREKCSIHDICSLIYIKKRRATTLTSAIRVFLMLYYRAAATEDGHARAGHGCFSNMLSRARLTMEVITSPGVAESVRADNQENRYLI